MIARGDGGVIECAQERQGLKPRAFQSGSQIGRRARGLDASRPALSGHAATRTRRN